ncbi:efflux RND transporter periplasmic adaptor subunit [Antarctobacter heliothermus]|uniref:Membrane fusion protein, multidrug efflux system n=1 Tax=Antarctobacter heliothermus TaxID=74033 RepID=A0A239EXE9_9RHOB|nr:efflux RND transporter periplasmic adaptor subunit [Antarctobacter heliothermus]SNS48713.1 membrane fusion protein, multidrug efflux system [Antarctobacter heliothermus]
MTEHQTDGPKPLSFENDHGSTRSRWVAGGLAVAIVGWMGSGFVLPSKDAGNTAKTPATPRAVSVAVRRSVAETVAQVFAAEGQALPDRDTPIRAKTSGQIGEVLVEKGADLAEDQVIARFDIAARQSDLDRAQQELARAQREYDNAAALVERGVATVDRVAQARATLAAAQASMTTATEAVANTEIRAPFAGRLESLDINEGEYVTMGDDVGRIVDNTPLTIRIQIPQQSLRDIKVGQTADVAFITGATGKGVVRFVSTSADAETRTFMAEIEVSNTDGAIPAGISAQLRIPTGELTAHFVSPAILSLDTDGTLGIKIVNDKDIVEFHKVRIVRAQTDGIWVSGLPKEAQIISIGQGFVNDGQTVSPKPEDEAEPLATRREVTQ